PTVSGLASAHTTHSTPFAARFAANRWRMCSKQTSKATSARQAKPGASSGCDSRPGKGNEPPHLESSLGRMEVTTWAKRRPSDVRAVTQVKRLSLVIRSTGGRQGRILGRHQYAPVRGEGAGDSGGV